jgi:hypothetical protein
MPTYYVTMTVEVPDEPDDADTGEVQLETALRSVAQEESWQIVSMTVVEASS